jgi:hypothetical protein
MGGGGTATGAKGSAAEVDDVPFEAAAATPARVVAAPSKPVVEEQEPVTESDSGSEASSRAADIISMIRKRQQNTER